MTTNMADLTTTLFRTDPTEGLVEYVQAVKPYHSKILDILVEYVFSESVSCRVTDKMALTVTFTSPNEGQPVLYTCGYGIVWDAYGDVASGDLPQASIISGDATTNTFVVQALPGPAYRYIVSNLQANQLTLVDSSGVPLTPDNVPYIPGGAAVEVATTGTFPGPLNGTSEYFLVATPTIGTFNLATKRYPTQFSDYVNLTSVGTGIQTVFRSEPFVPGDSVTVTGSSNNDGIYYISEIAPAGMNQYTVTMVQGLNISQGSGGQLVYTGNYGDPYCAPVSAPDLYTSAFITERLVFQFQDDPTTTSPGEPQGISIPPDPLTYMSPRGNDMSHVIDGLPHGFL